MVFSLGNFISTVPDTGIPIKVTTGKVLSAAGVVGTVAVGEVTLGVSDGLATASSGLVGVVAGAWYEVKLLAACLVELLALPLG